MKTLIAGFGNVLLGDDGFGVEVVRRLTPDHLPADTEAIEVGIGGFNFVLKLLDRYERTLVIDAVHRGDVAGTVYVFTPSEEELSLGASERLDPHLAEPSRALRLAQQLKVLPPLVTVIGCEAKTTELGIGLSEAVRAAVPLAVEKVLVILRSEATKDLLIESGDPSLRSG